MTLLQRFSLFCAFGSTTFAIASGIPKAILPDNVVLCASGSGCSNKKLFGRTYKVLETPRFTVMVSVSREGSYTRADVSITNNAGYPLNLSPDDFRLEVPGPKPRVLLYVAPADLKDIAPPPPVPTAETFIDPATPPPAASAVVTSAPAATDSTQPKLQTVSISTTPTVESTPDTPNIDELYLAAKKKAALQEAIDRATAQKDLAAVSISPNESVRGRVFFERDKKSKEVTVVLPIAGMVFEFPYILER
jgi:hypothetical protein